MAADLLIAQARDLWARLDDRNWGSYSGSSARLQVLSHLARARHYRRLGMPRSAATERDKAARAGRA